MWRWMDHLFGSASGPDVDMRRALGRLERNIDLVLDELRAIREGQAEQQATREAQAERLRVGLGRGETS